MSSIGPELPPHLRKTNNIEERSDKEFSVSFPQHLASREQNASIGPQLPPKAQCTPTNAAEVQQEEDDSTGYGPALPPGFSKGLSTKRIVGPNMRPQNPSS